jgi:hypothetical protein
VTVAQDGLLNLWNTASGYSLPLSLYHSALFVFCFLSSLCFAYNIVIVRRTVLASVNLPSTPLSMCANKDVILVGTKVCLRKRAANM